MPDCGSGDRNERCPICEQPAFTSALPEYGQTLVECSHCTTFTIEKDLAASFRRPQNFSELQRLRLLSLYLQQARDDDDREVTQTSWKIFASQATAEPEE